MVDNIDKKILYRLYKNSRSPLSNIAKDTGLTREIVSYRIRKMEEEKVILGYPAKINQAFFCEGVCNVLFKIIRSDAKRFKEILTFLQNHKAIHWMSELSGNADIDITFMYRNTEDLGNTISEIISFIGPNLKEHQLSLYITEYKFERKNILNPSIKTGIPEPIVSFQGKKKVKLDAEDIIILKELSKNSKIKNIDLAKKTSLSEDMVRLRIKKLEKQEVLFGYGVVVDVAQLGFDSYLLELQIEQMTKETISKLQYYVHSNPYIIYCSRTIGKNNIIISIHARNAAHFNEILLDIRNHFGTLITDYNFQQIIKELKEIYVPEEYII